MNQNSARRQVAIQQAYETEVFVNEDLNITIRQECMFGEEQFIWFAAANAPALIAAIQRAAAEVAGFEEDQA